MKNLRDMRRIIKLTSMSTFFVLPSIAISRSSSNPLIKIKKHKEVLYNSQKHKVLTSI